MELRVKEDKVEEILHTTRACAVCTASADLLAEYATGKDVSEVAALSTEQMVEMVGIPLSPIRLKCALLPLQTVRRALDPH
jgi:nitrogen fixation NifU-like protein